MRKIKTILPLLLLASLLAGCQMAGFNQQPTGAQSAKAPVSKYYDFDDVQVPSGMNMIQDRSMIFRVGDFKAGVLTFQDRVDSVSLINFYMSAMARDNWVLKGSFKSTTSALFFAKKGKTCVVQITEGSLDTTLEIWVAPTMQ
ncbi:hypothetical protein [Dethiosulfatarculus sandiegensis]|uniref:Lipoprotein n=1 Tax=Dethiosulfatarculus sandiegensis TaxID=1429043 RepID=A0A0D2J8W1_9BACT|nr:hypothetical protein [Dethiosulfatarculus sandiegensis]KIX12171.1 hypothetical protein X474_20560 [Dethiosulfatarculus sandiegensis]